MFRVSYLDNSSATFEHKGGFDSTKDAIEWVEAQGNRITALKLLVWDEEIQCYSVLKYL